MIDQVDKRYFLALLIFLIFSSAGCVSTQPFPSVARAGDTITLAVGSADGMTANNTTVEFFPGTDPAVVTPVPVAIRSIVKLYPDKTSSAWLDEGQIAARSSHGGWLSVVVVDLPQGLPEGDGVIQVRTNGEVTYPRFAATANGTDILMQILPGTGKSSTLDYYSLDGVSNPGDLTQAEALPQVIIKPPVPAEGQALSTAYGAVEINVTVPIIALDGSVVDDAGIAVVLDDQPQTITRQASMIWKRNGDNFSIMLVSPLGMYSFQSRVSIVPRTKDFLYILDSNNPPQLNSVTYYDLNGVPDTTGTTPVPTLTVIN